MLKEAIARLKEVGVKETIMLTGDVRTVANKVASDLNIDKVYSELLPQDKVNKVEELLEKNRKRKVGLCGRRYQ